MLITQSRKVVTQMYVFAVEPGRQQQLINTWSDVAQLLQNSPGLRATVLHRSLDGQRVLNYSQWESIEDWENFRQQKRDQFTKLTDSAQVDSHLYEVAYVAMPPGASIDQLDVSLSLNAATMINIFTVEPANQQRIIDDWIEANERFQHSPGLIGAALHCSLDGQRVVNYTQWERMEDWENLMQQGRSRFAKFANIARADPHLYEVILVR